MIHRYNKASLYYGFAAWMQPCNETSIRQYIIALLLQSIITLLS